MGWLDNSLFKLGQFVNIRINRIKGKMSSTIISKYMKHVI